MNEIEIVQTSPDEMELNSLIRERTQVLGQINQRTNGGKLPPDSETQLLAMQFEELTTEINQLMMSRSMYGKAADYRAKITPLMGYAAVAAARGLDALPMEQRTNFTVSAGTATILNPSSIGAFFAQFKAGNPVFELGARLFNPAGNFQQFPEEQNPATGQWIPEGGSITANSTASITSKKMDFKHYGCLLKAHNHWLEDSMLSGIPNLGPSILNEMMLSSAREAVAKVILSGASASNQPTGLDNLTSSGVQTVDGGGAVIADYDKTVDVVKKLLNYSVPAERIGGVISPEMWSQYAKLKDAEDRYLTMPEELRPVMDRTYVTAAALANYSGGTRTRGYWGDWSNCLVAMNGMPIVVLTERYAEDFQTGFLLSMRVDVQFLRRTAFCILVDVLNA